MPKPAGKLSNDCEYAIVWWGQSNAQPRGARDSEGFLAAPFLALPPAGQDLTISSIASHPTPGVSLHGAIGTFSTVTVVETLPIGHYAGAELRLVRTTPGAAGMHAASQKGHARVVANKVHTLVVEWLSDFQANGTAAVTNRVGYVHLPAKGKAYANVRVLTPYQPETPGDYPAGPPAVPGYPFPSDVATCEDAGLFLDYTWNEGLEGIGAAGLAGSGGPAPTATTMDDPAASWSPGMFAGGHVRCGLSRSAIGGNTGTQLTGLDWIGGTPAGGAAYEIHVPHWRDNPYHIVPGHGFRYPSNDMQPSSVSTVGQVYNRPRGRFTPGSYVVAGGVPQYRFGAMIACAWRLSQWLGRRIHVIELGIGASSLMRTGMLRGGAPAPIGWWDEGVLRDWSPTDTDGLAHRLRRMIQVMAPAALAAERNARKLRILGIVGFQGEADATIAAARSLYGQMLPAFYGWLRAVIHRSNLSPYTDAARIPVVHAKITRVPWELSSYQGIPLDNDVHGLVNAAITGFAATDGFAATFDTNDSPKLDPDVLHFNGVGEARNGALAADALANLVDTAL